MRIYKDIISEDELFSDVFPMKVDKHDFFYLLQGKQQQYKLGAEDINIGANPSAEEGGDDTAVEEGVYTDFNIKVAHKLIDTQFKTKKEYQLYMKDYLKAIKAKLPEDERVAFETKAKTALGEVIKEFKEYEFFLGESMADNGMVVLLRWITPEGQDDEVPFFYFIKDGVLGEKV